LEAKKDGPAAQAHYPAINRPPPNEDPYPIFTLPKGEKVHSEDGIKNGNANILSEEDTRYEPFESLNRISSGCKTGRDEALDLFKKHRPHEDIAALFTLECKTAGVDFELLACTYQDGVGDPDPEKGLSIWDGEEVRHLDKEDCINILQEGSQEYRSFFSSFD
jgi:hypothetical protein